MISRINSYNYSPVFTSKPILFGIHKEPANIENLNKLINNWAKKGLYNCNNSCMIIPKDSLAEVAKIEPYIAQTLPRADLSPKGFAVVAMSNETGEIDTKTLQYFDPNAIPDRRIREAIRTNKIMILPTKAKRSEENRIY